MLRATWMAQEILTTFADDISEVALRPGTGGVFEVWVGDQMIWERKRDGGFPSAKILKNKVRDAASPGKTLGKHLQDSDVSPQAQLDEGDSKDLT